MLTLQSSVFLDKVLRLCFSVLVTSQTAFQLNHFFFSPRKRNMMWACKTSAADSDLLEDISAGCWTVSGVVKTSAGQSRDKETGGHCCWGPTTAVAPGFQLLDIKKMEKLTWAVLKSHLSWVKENVCALSCTLGDNNYVVWMQIPETQKNVAIKKQNKNKF